MFTMEQNKKNKEQSQANEPIVHYSTGGKKLVFFSSFEQQEEYELKQMASLTKDELLNKLEDMRKFFLRDHLLPDGNWAPVKRIITIIKATTQ